MVLSSYFYHSRSSVLQILVHGNIFVSIASTSSRNILIDKKGPKEEFFGFEEGQKNIESSILKTN